MGRSKGAGRRNHDDDDFVPDLEEAEASDEDDVLDLTVEEEEARMEVEMRRDEEDEDYVASDMDADDIEFDEDEEDDYLSDEAAEDEVGKKGRRRSRQGARTRGGRRGVGRRRGRGGGTTAKNRMPRKRAAAGVVISDEEDIDLEAAFDSEADAEDGAYVLGAEDEVFHDFSTLSMKRDHANRPLWVCPDGRIFLETFSPVYKQAYDFLIAVAEPVSRPEVIHEYMLTPHSLYAAVSIGLDTSTILSVLDRLSKSKLPPEVRHFVRASTSNYGKVKLVLQRNKYFVESPYPKILRKLLKDDVIRKARVMPASVKPFTAREASARRSEDGDVVDPSTIPSSEFMVSRALKDAAVANLASIRDVDLEQAAEESQHMDQGGITTANDPHAMNVDAAGGGKTRALGSSVMGGDERAVTKNAAQKNKRSLFSEMMNERAEEDPDREIHSFEIDAAQVEHVKARCLPGGFEVSIDVYIDHMRAISLNICFDDVYNKN